MVSISEARHFGSSVPMAMATATSLWQWLRWPSPDALPAVASPWHPSPGDNAQGTHRQWGHQRLAWSYPIATVWPPRSNRKGMPACPCGCTGHLNRWSPLPLVATRILKQYSSFSHRLAQISKQNGYHKGIRKIHSVYLVRIQGLSGLGFSPWCKMPIDT
jgi:hypothetical protein